MKKFLLTVAAMAVCGASAMAASETFEVKNATDIKGTLHEEVAPSESNKYGSAKNYKPLESLKLGSYSFTFKQSAKESAPAYFFPMSTNENGEYTVRLYAGQNGAAGNIMTITCPEGKTMKSITFKGTKDNTAGAQIDVTAGKAVTTADKNVIWSSDEAVSTVTLTIYKQTRFTEVTISDEAVKIDEPTEPDQPTADIAVKKATEFAAGEVAFVLNEGYVETFAENDKYGYWYAVAATPADEMKVTKEAIFTIASTDKGYTITDTYGRFMGWDGSHWSFNAYKTSDEGNCYWDATMVDGTVKIVNKTKNGEKEVYLCGKKYNNDYEICPTDRDNSTLPMLYVKTESGVNNITVDNNAKAAYYNLQGVRVANPEKGLYIVVKGGKSQKVMF